MNLTDPQPPPLTAAEINSRDIVEVIMTAPLDQAVTITIGRASTCWVNLDTGEIDVAAGVFDDQTANRIVNALLARISAELAGSAADARGEDRAKSLIPTLAFPTEVRERVQCAERLRIEGEPHPVQCLLLEGGHGEHQNGTLRWRKDEATGEIVAWFDTQVYEAVGLGDLLRSGVYLTLPHLPADAAPDVKGELTPDKPPPALLLAVSETAPDAEESRHADQP